LSLHVHIADMRQLVKAVLTSAGGLALVGMLGWTTADAVNEALVYRHCQRYFMQVSVITTQPSVTNIAELAGFAYPRIGLQMAAENVELGEQVGLPLRPGPWYNASIGLTHGNHMANCQFTVIGSKHSSDIYMRVNSSCFSPLLYKLGFYTLPGKGGASCVSGSANR